MSPSPIVPLWQDTINKAPNPAQAFWQGKRVFITGASSGIGSALAKYLRQQGARVGLIARRQAALEALTHQLNQATTHQVAVPTTSPQPAQAQQNQHSQHIAWACADVTQSAEIEQAVQQLEQALGSCDVMIANAGIYHKTDVHHFDSSGQNAVIATNTQGVINTVGAVMPGMLRRKRGHIAAVASVAGMIGLPGAAAYSASKAAVVTMFQSLRADLYTQGIKVCVAAPGFVDTPLITDEERATVKDLLTAEQAAVQICRTIERDKAIRWFPWPTWLVCRLLSLLPDRLYRPLVANIPDMEETSPQPPSIHPHHSQSPQPQTEAKS